MDEHRILCPYCKAELQAGAESCPHCQRRFAGRNPAGALPVGTLLSLIGGPFFLYLLIRQRGGRTHDRTA